MEARTSHDLRVQRTARIEVAGEARGARELWIVLHGYAQTASEMLTACAPLAREDRLLVAPEALSRFYRRGSSGPIGASWMTREAREREIADYVAYLDDVGRWIRRELGCDLAPTVLGFSQGVATAWRWTALGSVRPQRLIACGAGIPPDLDLAAVREKLAHMGLDFVRGVDDGYHTAEWAERDRTRLAALELGCQLHEFAGGHELPPDLLRAL